MTPIIHNSERKALTKLPSQVFKKLNAFACEYKDFGRLPQKKAKKISGRLWEFRIKHKGNQWRFLYAEKYDNLYILRILLKKTQKIPKRELDLALQRSKEIDIPVSH